MYIFLHKFGSKFDLEQFYITCVLSGVMQERNAKFELDKIQDIIVKVV